MCGRYILAQQAKAEKAFGVMRLRWRDMLSYNVTPTREVPVVRMAPADGGEREGVMMRWGLVPPFLKGESPKYATHNARIETMETSPAFRDAWKNGQRCIVPAEGFYEWREEDGLEQPYFFARKDGKPVMFAGIWDYSEVKGETVPSFAILTDEPNELVAPYHDRMPVVLDDAEQWLDVELPLDSVNPLGPERFVVRAVNRAVNKVSEKNIEAIERVA